MFGLCAYPSQHGGNKDWYTEDEKRTLDEVHKNKIAASEAVLVLNVFGYLGESTLSEIAFARSRGIQLHALESWGEGYGIGPNHHRWLRHAADRYVPDGCVSPIDMTYRADVRDPWLLLCPASTRRTRIVRRLAKTAAALTGKPLCEHAVEPDICSLCHEARALLGGGGT